MEPNRLLVGHKMYHPPLPYFSSANIGLPVPVYLLKPHIIITFIFTAVGMMNFYGQTTTITSMYRSVH